MGTAKKALGHNSERRGREHHSAELLDFSKSNRYTWQNVNHTVRDCIVTRLEGEVRPVCIAHAANLTGHHSIGEDYKLNVYLEHVERQGYWAEITVLVEVDKPTYPRGWKEVKGMITISITTVSISILV